jgi:hypothetical protein
LKEITGADENQLLNLIDLFIKDRRSFLIISNAGKSGDKVIDISHESLIRQWNTLSNWVDEEGEAASGYIQLAQAASKFKQKKRDFLDGTELNISMQWFERFKPVATWANRYEEGFSGTIDYLLQSRKVHDEKEQLQKRQAGKNNASWLLALSCYCFWRLVLLHWLLNSKILLMNRIKIKASGKFIICIPKQNWLLKRIQRRP